MIANNQKRGLVWEPIQDTMDPREAYPSNYLIGLYTRPMIRTKELGHSMIVVQEESLAHQVT